MILTELLRVKTHHNLFVLFYDIFRYMRQVIDETLRCAVIGPWGARFQDSDSELGGHKIPKNVRKQKVKN